MTGIPVSKCISRLKKAKNDTEKFAALLMVSKVVRSDECSDEERGEVFDAVGFIFVHRLLKTKVEDAPDGTSDRSYQHLALNLLSSFCSIGKYVASPEMYKTLPLVNNLLLLFEKCPVEDADVNLVDDCYQCLTCVANRAEGREALVSHRTVSTLCTVVSRELYGWEKALSLLRFILHHCGSTSWTQNIEGLEELLIAWCAKYEEGKDQGKFEIGKLLAEVLSSTNKEVIQGSNGTWKKSIHKTLFEVLRNKLGGEQRDATIPLAAALVDVLGVNWVLKPSGSEIPSDELMHNRKSLLLLVHLICIEVRMSLEDKTFIQVNERATILCSCYSVLENVIEHMTLQETLDLDDKQTSQLYTAMLGAFSGVIQFLDEVRTQYVDQVLSVVTLASVRVLGAWIAEETTALQKDVVQLLPFLLQVGKDSFELLRGVVDSHEGHGSMEIEIPGKRMTPATDVLKFLLPGICHLTTDESARKVFLEENGHTLLAQYFSHQIKLTSNVGERQEVEGSILTTCGVFLNLSVLEPGLVSRDVAFNDILHYILHNVHLLDTDRQLVYLFNLAVLGLMILRHKISQQGSEEIPDCGQFFNTVIKLVSRSHVCRKVNGKNDMVLCGDYAPQWENIAELWFLAMQSLAACVPLLPWLSTMIMKTGWIPTLLSMLWDTKGEKPDVEVLVSYKVLLCELSSNSDASKKIIKERKGLEIARAHSMKELENILR